MNTLSSLAATAAALLLAGATATSQTAQSNAPQQSTAPPQNLPYVAVHNPQFTSASEATFLQPEDRVIGVIEGTVAKAFPAGILAQHGLVEDEAAAGGPIAVTW